MTGINLQDGQANLPSRDSTVSYWHTEPKLIGHRSTKDLPVQVDVVVVGSGITGAFAAREVVLAGKAVCMIESREACWGATGRNGGHCQPSIYTNLPHMARFELDTYNFIKHLIEEHSIPCDWTTVDGVHAMTSTTVLDLVQQRITQLQRSHPDLAREVKLVTDPEELKQLRLGERCVAAVVQSCAAGLWPYKLVTWILEDLLEKGLNLQTNTNATHIQPYHNKWIVHMDRGQITASHVILATNGYTSYLLPQFSHLITPVRGQVAALHASSEQALPPGHSYVWTTKQPSDPAESDDYLIQRPSSTLLILGGERNSTNNSGRGISADDEVDELVSARLHCALGKTLMGFPERMGRARYEWTGVMGYSADGWPWVGRVPEGLGGSGGEGGLWIAAGYTGHGMPVAARCGVAVGRMALGIDDDEDGVVVVPEEWEVSEKRAEGLRKNAVGGLERVSLDGMFKGTWEDELRELVEQHSL